MLPREYERHIAATLRNDRDDVFELFPLGQEIELDFQHRLWRYGPELNNPMGTWHRDTSPWGIGGAVPEGSIMFTLVYILDLENVDPETAGTRRGVCRTGVLWAYAERGLAMWIACQHSMFLVVSC